MSSPLANNAPARFVPVLAAGFAIQAFSSAALNCSPLFAPVVAPAMGLPPHWVSIYYFIATGTGMLAGLASHVWIARQGPVRAMQLGMLGMALALAAAVGGSAAFLLLSAFLTGFGYSPVGPGSSLIVTNASPANRIGLALSVKQSGAPVGIGLAGALIPASMLAFGWEATALAFAATGAAITLLVQPLRGHTDRERRETRFEWRSTLVPIKVVWNHPALRSLAGAALGLSIVQTGLIVYAVSYLHFDRGASLVVAGLALTGSQVISVPARLVWGWIADRTGDPLRTLYWLSLGSLAFSIALALYPSTLPFVPAAILITLFGASGGAWNGVNLATAAKYAPKEFFTQAYAGIIFAMFVGGMLSALAFGLVVELAGNFASVFAASSVIALAVSLTLRARLARTASQPAP